MTYLARPYHIPCDVRQAMPYTIWCPPDHGIYHAMAARPSNISCCAHQAIPYTIPCPPGHSIYHVMPARPYHILCQAQCLACQAITIYHAMPARPYHIPCVARRPYYTMRCPQAIKYPMSGPPGHTIIPCDARKATLYTMRGPPGHTRHLATPARPYHIP